MNKKYYIFVGNEKIEVDQKIYQNYWQITNRENYLERLDRNDMYPESWTHVMN